MADFDSPEFETLIERGRALLGDHRDQEAYRYLQRALETCPDSAPINLLMGIASRRLGRDEEAADHLHLALHYRPEDASAHCELALVLSATGRLAEAAEHFGEAVRIAPNFAEGYRQLGLLHMKRGQIVEAKEALDRALALAPRDAYARSDLAYLLFRQYGQVEAAIGHLDRALSDSPDCIDALVNRGLVEQHLGNWRDALRCYERALELGSEVPEARLNRGLIRLMSKDFERGWRDYEQRTRIGRATPGMRFPVEQWQGEPLHGKRLLVYGEQGLGDEIMFASCLPDLLAIAPEVLLYCSPKLESLFSRSFPTLQVASGEQTGYSEFSSRFSWRPELKVAIGSLALAFRSRVEDFARPRAYLRSDEARVQAWRERLAAMGAGMKVGISWRGGTAQTRRNERSVALAELVPILEVPGVHFVSLQYGECTEEVEALRLEHGIDVRHFPDVIADCDETAALVCALDLVISVCTAVIHLGGALGKTVWVLVPSVPEWRYMLEGDRMLWYPSVALYRQCEPGRWRQPIAEVASRLGSLAQGACC